MKILITNIVALNGGDGAILFGMIKALKRAFGDNCEFIVFCTEPEASARMYPGIEFRETLGVAATHMGQRTYLTRAIRFIRSLIYLLCAKLYVHGLRFVPRLLLGKEKARDFADYASADLVVSSGGTYLNEDYGIVSQVCDYRITLLLKRPLVFYTQTLGPFKEMKSKAALLPIFNAARAVLLRDERSRRNLLEIGVRPDRLHVSPDAAFALADPGVLELAKKKETLAKRPLKIAISVRRWAHFKNKTAQEGMECYLTMMADLTRWLVNDLNAEVTFLSTCQGNNEYDDDAVIAAQVLKRLGTQTAARVNLISRFVRFDELLQIIPNYDLVIATRMHMAILSLMSGTPAIPMVLEFKTSQLYSNLGIANWVIEVEQFDSIEARRKISDLVTRIPLLRAELFDRVKEQVEGALAGGFLVKTSLSKQV